MRIVWTKDEKRALKECMIDICFAKPTISNKELLRKAQEEVIPYERRHVITDQRVFTYKTMMAEARKIAEDHRAKTNKPKAAPLPEPMPAPPPIKLDTLGEVFELFIDALADRIMAKIAAAKQEVEEPIEQEEPDGDFKGLYPMEMLKKLTIRAKPKLPTVLVVGLNGVQMECVKLSRSDLDFTFVNAEQALSRHTYNKDHTILMTKFISHSAQAKYRMHNNLHYCNGGVSDLGHLLRVIFHKEAA
jgi:hypothetical protein